ncbi:MAG: hypothetical protein F6K04_02310 [Leptolyngbya sp. SIO4C5]|nr:hypothetical protein [Leptolyngbya sp. SIO4C5]
MSKFLTPRQAWNLSVRNAAAAGEVLPLPDSSPTLNPSQLKLWTDVVYRQVRAGEIPSLPSEWLAVQSGPAEAPWQQSQQLWNRVAQSRQGQNSESPAPPPEWRNLTQPEYERLKAELEQQSQTINELRGYQ